MNHRIENYSKIQNVLIPLTLADVKTNGEARKRIHLNFKPKYVCCKVMMVDDDTKDEICSVRCNFTKDETLCVFPKYDPVHQDSTFRECLPDMSSNEYYFSFWELRAGNASFVNKWDTGTLCSLSLTFIN